MPILDIEDSAGRDLRSPPGASKRPMVHRMFSGAGAGVRRARVVLDGDDGREPDDSQPVHATPAREPVLDAAADSASRRIASADVDADADADAGDVHADDAITAAPAAGKAAAAATSGPGMHDDLQGWLAHRKAAWKAARAAKKTERMQVCACAWFRWLDHAATVREHGQVGVQTLLLCSAISRR